MNSNSLAKVLEFFAEHQPYNIAYRFINNEKESIAINYKDLHTQALKIANLIQSNILKKTIQDGSGVVLLLLPTGIDFIISFFACFYSNVISVPVSIPKANKSLFLFERIIEDSKACLVLTNIEIFSNLISSSSLLQRFPKLSWLTINNSAVEEIRSNKIFYPSNDKIAFLQYTSGSTSVPKGVMVSHGNIIANQQMIKNAFNHNENTVFVSWLPLFHDMGLIGTILQPMYLGVPSTLMTPNSFLASPSLWLETISQYKATTSGAPNFAYDLCIDRITEEDKEKFDLKSWKIAFNGAEPIRKQTMINFYNKFADCGFSNTAFFPCYGLAEATLFVSGRHFNVDKDIGPYNTTTSKNQNAELVSVGQGSKPQQIKIINPETQMECPKNIEGEIWIHGPHIALGYWQKEKETQCSFCCKISNEFYGNYLRTGDLGIIDNLGELYVTGRLKDLIILQGRNIHPNDIEFMITTVSKAISGSIAFSTVIQGIEQLVVIIEIERSWIKKIVLSDLQRKILALIVSVYNITPYKIVFLKPRHLPRTTSGKVQRQLCKKLFIEQKLDLLNLKLNPKQNIKKENNIVDSKLIQIVSDVLKVNKELIDVFTPLYEYGIDSIKAIEFQIKIKKHYLVDINFAIFLESYNLLDIYQFIKLREKDLLINKNENIIIDHEVNNLSAQEYGMWLFDNISKQKYAYNVARVVEVLTKINHNIFIKALKATMSQHKQLCTIFPRDKNGNPFRKIIQDQPPPFKVYNKIDNSDLSVIFNKELVEVFNLEHYPLFRVILLYTKDAKCYLYFSAHHIICDLSSLKILIINLFKNYFYLTNKSNFDNLFQCSEESYVSYIIWQNRYLQSDQAKKDLTYWINQFDKLPTPVITSNLHINTNIQTYIGNHLEIIIEEKIGELVLNLSKEEKVTPYVIFLSTYFLLMFLLNPKSESITIGSTFNNRGAQWNSTIGLFANPLPISVNFNKLITFRDILKATKVSTINSLKNSSLPIGLITAEVKRRLKFITNPSFHPLFQLMFVYQELDYEEKKWNCLAVPFLNEVINIKNTKLLPFNWLPPVSNFFVSLFMTSNTNNRFSGYFEFNTDIVDRKTIQLMKENFLALLSLNVNDPNLQLVKITKIINLKLLKESLYQ